MKVFVFDLLPYGENLEHLKNGGTELPWPLEKRFFRPEVAVRTYAEHLDAWEELDKLAAGQDAVWVWTKGHASHEDNNRCDELAQMAAREQRACSS